MKWFFYRIGPWLVLLLIGGGSALHGAAEVPATNGFSFVDLSSMAVKAEEPAGRQFSALPKGVQSFHGIPFRAELPAAVAGIEAARGGELYPSSIRGIPIGGAVRRMHLLHATSFADKDGTPLASIIFHYRNGGDETVRLGYGVHARAWVTPRLEKRAELFDPNSREAWTETDDRRGAGMRLFQTSIENPRPGEAIASIDVVSLFSHAAPFIVAMTAEGPESGLAPNHPPSTRKPVRDLHEFGDAAYRGELSARVTDAETGAPLTNAVASLSITDDKDAFYFGGTNADAQGWVRFPYPPQHAVGVSLWVHAPDRMPVVVAESKTNISQFAGTYAVTLRRGTTIGGVVKASDGQAVAGAQVNVYQVTRLSPHHYTRTDYDMATTGADGKWTSHCLPPDLTGFSFQVTHPAYRPSSYVTAGYAPSAESAAVTTTTTSTSVSYRRLPDGTLEPMTTRRMTGGRVPGMSLITSNALLSATAEMVLQPAIILQGTLTDPAGNAVSAAEVILQRQDGGRKYLRTDAKGHFETRLGEPGDAAVIVLHEGFTPVWRSVNVVPGVAPVEIKLAPARVLRGRVQDRNARPVGGARVRLDDWNDTSDLLKFRAVTDEEGAFTWTGAPSDQATLFVSKTNYTNTRHSFSGTADNVIIPISRPAGVYGRVFDSETRKPVETFMVIPGRKYSQGEAQTHWDRSEGMRGSGGEYSLRMSSYFFQPEARVLVEAPGYEPQVSRGFSSMDAYTNDFALKRGQGTRGVVQLPDGSPASGAALVIIEKGESGYLDPAGQVRGNGGSADLVRADAQGHFEFMPKLEPDKIFASHEQGFGEAKVADVAKGAPITLQKWGRVKGVMRVGDKPGPDETVRLQKNYDMVVEGDGRAAGFSFSMKADPDEDGNFAFEKVPPGEHRLALEYHFKDDRNGDTPWSHGLLVDVKPGATADVTLGGTGRRVAGRVKILGGDPSDVDWRRDVHRLALVLPNDGGAPGNLRAAAPQESLGLLGALFGRAAPQPQVNVEAMRQRQRAERTYVLLFDTNGTFHADNVPPGKYYLTLNVTDPEDEYYNRRSIGALNKEIIVPDEKAARVNAPLDIGELELAIRARVKLGKIVPSFEAKTTDGKTVKLSDFRGKPVLLHFWGLSLGYSSYDMQMLKEIQTNHGRAGRLTILGCNLDANTQGAEQFVKNQGMTWTQTYLGEWSQTPIPGMFGLNGNSGCVLVDAEGKLASGQLRGTAIRNAVANAIAE